MRSITSKLFIAPIAAAAFLLVVATSMPIQIAPAWADGEPVELSLTSSSEAVSVEQSSEGGVLREGLLVQIAPQPEPVAEDPSPPTSTSTDATPAAVSTATGALAPIAGGASRDGILADLNAQRAGAGLPPFASQSGLMDVAQQWSTYQASTASMIHNPAFASQTAGAGCGGATENVASAMGSISPVAAWMASPPHRANILSSATHLGVGAATSTNGITYYTLNFASC